jgi:hypothetical protein
MTKSSRSSGSGASLPPLSIGNVVSTGFRLYKTHFKNHLKLSLVAHLWLFVPFFGWAKYAAAHGLLSRLIFSELIDRPETVSDARLKVDPLKWSFFSVGLQVVLRVMLAYLGLIVVGIIVFGIIGAALSAILGSGAAPIVIGLLTIIGICLLVLAITWFYSRLVISEVPLAMEEGMNSSRSVDRSWSLTEAAVFRIQGVVLVAFVVTLPLLFFSNYVFLIFMLPLERTSALYQTLNIIQTIVSLLGAAIVMPFWQAIKAVLYYDLRTRREGLDLSLSDR